MNSIALETLRNIGEKKRRRYDDGMTLTMTRTTSL